jgi:hypothetical protein
MSERDAARLTLARLGAEDLIPMLGLDQPEPRYTVHDAYRPGRTAKPKGMRTSPHYRGSAA